MDKEQKKTKTFYHSVELKPSCINLGNTNFTWDILDAFILVVVRFLFYLKAW